MRTNDSLTRILLAAALVVAWGPGASSSRAEMLKPDQTLRGLPGLRVIVAELRPEAEGLGIRADALRTSVEEHLRAGGVRVLTEAEWAAHPASPYLWLHVHLLRTEQIADLVLYDVSLEVRQVIVLTTGNQADGVTLRVGFLGAVGSALAASSVQTAVLGQVEAVVQAWRSQNVAVPPPGAGKSSRPGPGAGI